MIIHAGCVWHSPESFDLRQTSKSTTTPPSPVLISVPASIPVPVPVGQLPARARSHRQCGRGPQTAKTHGVLSRPRQQTTQRLPAPVALCPEIGTMAVPPHPFLLSFFVEWPT